MKNHGITLVELIVVIAIISILAVALGFSYVGWQGAYKVEKTTKDLFTDLMDARTRAMTRGREYYADFPAVTIYRVIEDTNGNGASNPGAGDTVLATFPKTSEYPITWNAGGTITFNPRGIISTPGTICLTTTANPDYDCIKISQTRINMGKLTTQISAGGDCNATNCVAK